MSNWQSALERLLGRTLPPVSNPAPLYQTLVRYPDNDQRLIAMVRAGDYDAVQLLLYAGVSKVALGHALIEAVHWGFEPIVALLLEQPGISQQAMDSALNLAAKITRLDMIDRLIKTGADVNNDRRPLLLAISNTKESLALVKRLVQAGANIHIDDDLALLIAVRGNLREIAAFLLEQGANVNAAGGKAIDEALRQNNQSMILLLVKYGAEIQPYIPQELPSPIRRQIGGIFKQQMMSNQPVKRQIVPATTAAQTTPRSPKKETTISPKKEIKASSTSPKKQSSISPKKQSTGPLSSISPKKEPKRSFTSPKKEIVASSARKTPPQSPRRANQPTVATDRPQCAAITQAGTQCSFRAKEGSIYCGKHQK